ncbi:MAG: endonuclease/exonuclease/phosphatase family protein [Pseudomonadota bacterium]
MVILAGLGTAIDGRLDLLSHFRAHLGLALIGAALVFLLLKAPVRGALSGVAGCAALATLVPVLWLNAAKPTGGDPMLRILHFNMLGENRRADEIATLIRAEEPDVVFLLEGTPMEPHFEALSDLYPYRLPCQWAVNRCDLQVLSRLPLDEAELQPMPHSGNRVAMLPFTLGGQEITVVGAHFSKPYQDGVLWWQLHHMADRLAAIETPLVLVGDFNATPWSKLLVDFKEKAGFRYVAGFRGSWPAEAGPLGFPIDHALVRGRAVPTDIAMLADDFGSNHRGFILGIAITP